MTVQGQPTFESAGQPRGYMVNPHLETRLYHESRLASVVGNLGKLMTDEDIGTGPYANKTPVDDAVILSKVVTSGDEYRFQLSQNLGGGAVFGDMRPNPGDYMAFLNATVYMNLLKCPKYPLLEVMSLQRINGVLTSASLTEEMKRQMKLWFAEQYTMDFYQSLLTGASQSLFSATAAGGRALNLGLGAGVQVSPQHFVAAGTTGFVSGVSGTQGYEDNLLTALQGLTDDTTHQISRKFLHDLDAAADDRKQIPVQGGVLAPDSTKFICLCDPDLLVSLSAPGGPLWEDWRLAMERGKNNPVFKNQAIDLGRLLLVPDPWIKKYRPDITGGSVVWGRSDADNDKRDFVSTSNIGLMFVLGKTPMLEAVNGEMEATFHEGEHKVGSTWSGMTKQAFMRTRWVPKDGRALSSSSLIERGLMVAAFNIPAVTL